MDYAAYPVVGYDTALNYVALDTVVNEYYNEAMWACMYPVERGMFAITNVCEYPELMCAWVDMLYSEPLNYRALIGEEGVSWQWSGEGEDRSWDYIISSTERNDYMKRNTIQHGGGLPYLSPSREFFMKSADPVTVATYEAEAKIAAIGFQGFPDLTLKDESSVKHLSVLYTDISKYIDTLKANVIEGNKTVQEAYSDYDTMYRRLNIQTYCNLYQEVYEEYIEE